MVGFGPTKLSLRLSCTELCALSSGHGPRGQGFEGGEETLDFHAFLGVKKRKNMKMQDGHGLICVSGVGFVCGVGYSRPPSKDGNLATDP